MCHWCRRSREGVHPVVRVKKIARPNRTDVVELLGTVMEGEMLGRSHESGWSMVMTQRVSRRIVYHVTTLSGFLAILSAHSTGVCPLGMHILKRKSFICPTGFLSLRAR